MTIAFNDPKGTFDDVFEEKIKTIARVKHGYLFDAMEAVREPITFQQRISTTISFLTS